MGFLKDFIFAADENSENQQQATPAKETHIKFPTASDSPTPITFPKTETPSFTPTPTFTPSTPSADVSSDYLNKALEVY